MEKGIQGSGLREGTVGKWMQRSGLGRGLWKKGCR